MNIRSERLWGVVAILLVPSIATSDQPQLRTVSVTGTGSVDAAPDMASFETAVITESKTAAEAMSGNSELVAKLQQTLKQKKIAENDIQTVRVDVSPVYVRGPGGGRGSSSAQRQIVGYMATNQMRVHVRNLTELGGVLDSVVQAGSNQVSGIRFDIDDKTGLLDRARSQALRDARRRAELYAQAAGADVGFVISIREAGTPTPRPQPMMRAMAAEAVPIAPGQQQIGASVHVVYELNPR